MTDIVWPSDLAPFRVAFYLQPYTGGSESPFTRQRKTYGLAAPRWIARLTFRGGVDGSAGEESFGPRIDALIARLRGGQNRVALFDWRRPVPRGGVAGHALTTALASPAGSNQLDMAGGPAGQVGFLAGDYLGLVGGMLVMAVDEPVVRGDGHVTVTIEPPLKRDVAVGEAIDLIEPTAWFKLTSDDAGDNEAEVGQTAVYTLEFVEDL